MIDTQKLQQFIEDKLADYGYFLVELNVGKDNDIVVSIDSEDYVDIDHCIELTRAIESEFPRDEEDYSLEVGSCGITSPLKVRRQFEKNIGSKVSVVTADGRKLKGVLDSVTDDGFVLCYEEKVKKEGVKRPVVETRCEGISFGNAKEVVPEIDF